MGRLPAIESYGSNYLVDPVDDVLHNDWGLVRLQGFEELGQGSLALLFTRHLIDGLLRRHGVAGQFQEVSEEIQAGLLDAGLLLAKSVESLAEFDEDRVVEVAGDAGSDLFFDFFLRYVLALTLHQVFDGLCI